MITNPSHYNSFKRGSTASQDLSLDAKYAILDALYAEARQLGSFGERDRLLGLEDDVQLAAALNANVSEASR